VLTNKVIELNDLTFNIEHEKERERQREIGAKGPGIQMSSRTTSSVPSSFRADSSVSMVSMASTVGSIDTPMTANPLAADARLQEKNKSLQNEVKALKGQVRAAKRAWSERETSAKRARIERGASAERARSKSNSGAPASRAGRVARFPSLTPADSSRSCRRKEQGEAAEGEVREAPQKDRTGSCTTTTTATRTSSTRKQASAPTIDLSNGD
jgi:hypothetical protein